MMQVISDQLPARISLIWIKTFAEINQIMQERPMKKKRFTEEQTHSILKES